ncbi:MAG: hypothetical protein K6D59_01525 [Bacteroidales bacterium]|nr:hypothetical protein [Bacteroidales bacterium]
MSSNNIQSIAKSISQHRTDEERLGKRNIGVARAECTISSATMAPRNYTLWLTNASNNPMQLHTEDLTISKNCKVGEAIIKGITGRHKYDGPMGRIHTIEIHNRTDYTPVGGTVRAKDLTLHLVNDYNTYFYHTLQEMLDDAMQMRNELIKEIERQKKLEEEKERIKKEREEAMRAALRAKEEAERKRLEEEARRLEEERRQKEEEERRQKEEVERMENLYREQQAKVAAMRSFIREGVSLRSQHILDPTQETAKRSHFYDGVPIIIEGGPGTGKTTTMIQRLMFLLSPDALRDYASPLTEVQKQELTDDISYKWLFFSPTPLLLRYLMNNMNEEGLSAVEGKNIITIDDFRKEMLSEYHLFNMDTDGPFKNFKKSKEQPLIFAPQTAISEFEKFCVHNLSTILLNAGTLKTDKFGWHKDALGIKSYCMRAAKVQDIEALMRLFNALQDNEQKVAKEKDAELRELLQKKAVELKSFIMNDDKMIGEIKELFAKWDAERKKEDMTDADEDEMDDSNEDEMEEVVVREFEPRLFAYLKSFLRRYALNKLDSKTKMSARQRIFSHIVIDTLSAMDLQQVGELAFFSKKYLFLCRGIESNIINQIPRLYKVYRKKVAAADTSACYNRELLKKLIEKDDNKHLHYDEQDLLIGFINNMAIDIRKRSKERYEKLLKNKYIQAYDNNKKPVIGIDEATDYTVMDYYMMYSFRHYDYNAVTLCGDIMQGLNAHGIMAWSEIQKVMPKLEVTELKTSYRQIPSLVDMSRNIYRDEQGDYPPYQSLRQKTEGEPQPLVMISDDEDEKIEWMVARLREVYAAYNKEMPSVGVFIPNGESVDRFVRRLREEDDLGEIRIESGSETTASRAVKVYELNEVKGMEFEVVFFYNLDKALQGDDREMMSRYLYVGISRATSHLAATLSGEEGNEDILKYFDLNAKDWKM